MSDRDDDGYNSPEGKGSLEEEQRRKAALAQQLTVDGGSDESGPPKPFDMNVGDHYLAHPFPQLDQRPPGVSGGMEHEEQKDD